VALYYKLGALIEKEEDLWTNPYWQERSRIESFWINKIDCLAKYLLDLRRDYKTNKNYKKADEIRDLLNSINIEVQDLPNGESVHYVL